MLVNVGFGSITTFIALHGQEQGIDQVSAYLMHSETAVLNSEAGDDVF